MSEDPAQSKNLKKKKKGQLKVGTVSVGSDPLPIAHVRKCHASHRESGRTQSLPLKTTVPKTHSTRTRAIQHHSTKGEGKKKKKRKFSITKFFS